MKGDQWQMALGLLRDAVTYNASINSFSKDGLWLAWVQELAWALCLWNTVVGVAPCVVSYKAAMSACVKGGL